MPSPATTTAAASAATDVHAAPAIVANYWRTLECAWREHDWRDFSALLETLQLCWTENRQVFLCGNGGSAANAIHLANDLLYGVDKKAGHGLRVTAWYGVRIFTDTAPGDAEPPPDLASLLDCEERAGRTDPYRQVAALRHVIARKGE